MSAPHLWAIVRPREVTSLSRRRCYGYGGVDGDADCGGGVDHVVHVPGAVGLLVDDEVLLARARVGRDQMYRDGLNDLTKSRVL